VLIAIMLIVTIWVHTPMRRYHKETDRLPENFFFIQ
jgi:hypothetical protein